MMVHYVDTSILIYYYDFSGPFQIRSRQWMTSLLLAGDTLAVSDLVRMEYLVGPLRSGDLMKVKVFDAFFTAPTVQKTPLTFAVFDRAASIRANHGFKTPDSIHLAAAIESGCDRFLTHDARLARFNGINVEILP
jgi:predicted nucleic acid-binding protein